MGNRKAAFLLSSWKIARAYWFSEEKWSAWGLLLTVIALNLGIVYILVLLNLWQVSFYEVIQNYNYSGFIQAIKEYSLLAACLVIVRGYQIYARMILHIRWRRWMTQRYLSDWLWNKTYYLLNISVGHDMDNPDQRISEDVELFVWLTLRLSLDLLQDVVTILSFISILWNLSGVLYISVMGYHLPIYGYLVWAAIIYAGFGTYWTVRMGQPLVKMDFDQQRYEADFRFSLMRLRENAESIALYDGEKQEKWNCSKDFKQIVGNYLKIILVRKRLMWLTTGYTQVSAVFASLVAAPRYFSSHIHLGQMFQIVDAYHHVQTGFSFVIDSFTRIAHWRAVVNRLTHFLVSMEMVRTQSAVAYQLVICKKKCKEYSVENLNVFLPDDTPLLSNFSLSLHGAERLLIMGPSGCGKSTLLRTFAGIWPYASGKMIVPEGEKIMFVPQKSYMPLASLRDIFQYPGLEKMVSDEELQFILIKCKLEHLFDKLDIVIDWGQVLSLGEQQRVAFVRVLLQKPYWLFLDEATSALDEQIEEQIYKMLIEKLSKTSIVSVGHRRTLMAYHQTRLQLDNDKNWKIIKM
ncbi:ABC transporter ATP-binding protein/permease [Pelosinus sp. sgz500959]|uniref:ABC transporter ATP-binding protein/permease n=1 Tax=Pelosinus sp. sgz500959 TaxID=3242472 RepID=UPI00366C8C63